MFTLRYVFAGSRARLLYSLTGVLLVATTTALAAVVGSAARSQIEAEKTTLRSIARLGADLVVTRDPEDAGPRAVSGLQEGTHATTGSV
ncbi:MAG: hypothetical protein Q7W30_01290, partial [Coriobacteriia bacterium]|nr:hypothetical protein [Coriobacteriia bacterium]